jgi:hypothetical protein
MTLESSIWHSNLLSFLYRITAQSIGWINGARAFPGAHPPEKLVRAAISRAGVLLTLR